MLAEQISAGGFRTESACTRTPRFCKDPRDQVPVKSQLFDSRVAGRGCKTLTLGVIKGQNSLLAPLGLHDLRLSWKNNAVSCWKQGQACWSWFCSYSCSTSLFNPILELSQVNVSILFCIAPGLFIRQNIGTRI